MVKNKVSVKNELSIEDRTSITDLVVDSYFTKNQDTNEMVYTPYFREIALIRCFADYILTGVDFEENDDTYELVKSDKELNDLYSDWSGYDENYFTIMYDVDDIVGFKKKQLLNQNNEVYKYVADILKEQLENQKLQNEVLKQQKELNAVMTPEEQKQFADKLISITDEKKLISEITKIASKVSKVKTPQDRKKSQSKINSKINNNVDTAINNAIEATTHASELGE